MVYLQPIFPPILLLMFLLCFVGWGGLVTSPRSPAQPLTCCYSILIGAAVFSWLVGWMSYFDAFTPIRGAAVLITGAVAGVFCCRTYFHATIWRQARAAEWATIALAGAMLLFCVYLPPAFNLNDDSTGYVVFPIKIRDLGGIGVDPFSARKSFALGANYPIQSIILSFLSIQHLSISEPALGIALMVLFLLVLSSRTAGGWTNVFCGILLLWIVCLSGSNVLTNLAPAYLMVPPIFLLVATAIGSNAVFSRMSSYGAALGVTAGYLTCLRVSALPMTGILVALGIFREARRRNVAWKMEFVRGAVAALLAIVLFVLPFSLGLEQSSGKYLPIRAGSEPRAVRPPTPLSMYLGNVAKVPFSDLLLMVTATAFLLWSTAQIPHVSRKRAMLVFMGILLNYALVVYASRGVGTDRYLAPILLAFLLYLISTSEFAGGTQKMRAIVSSYSRLGPASGIAGISILAIAASLLAYGYSSQAAKWVQNKISVREKTLFPPESEIRAYRELQRVFPKGATVLCNLERTYLLDFKRNRIFVNDLPGMFGPVPGWMRVTGSKSMADYLRRNGVDYVAVRAADHTMAGKEQAEAWSVIESENRRFEASLAAQPFADSLVFKSERFRVYSVPK